MIAINSEPIDTKWQSSFVAMLPEIEQKLHLAFGRLDPESREDAIEEAWRIVGPVLDNRTPVHIYEPNTWGPAEADQMVGWVGGWRNPAPTDV